MHKQQVHFASGDKSEMLKIILNFEIFLFIISII